MGSTGVSFKRRYNQHKYSMDNSNGQQTKLSKFYSINKNIYEYVRLTILYKVREFALKKGTGKNSTASLKHKASL